MVFFGKVIKIIDNVVFVKFSEFVVGFVFLCDFVDDYEEVNFLKYFKYEIVCVVVFDIDKSNKRLRLLMCFFCVFSLRFEVIDKEIIKDIKIVVGDVFCGFVKNVFDKGFFVMFGGDIVVMV